MATKKNHPHSLTLRLAPDMRQKFINLAAKFGGTSHVLRELIAGFVENRVQIKPPSLKGTLYHVENE